MLVFLPGCLLRNIKARCSSKETRGVTCQNLISTSTSSIHIASKKLGLMISGPIPTSKVPSSLGRRIKVYALSCMQVTGPSIPVINLEIVSSHTHVRIRRQPLENNNCGHDSTASTSLQKGSSCYHYESIHPSPYSAVSSIEHFRSER